MATTPTQPKLFILEEAASTGAVELFPAVWSAAERLASPRAEQRHKALDVLLELRAPRFSPLVAYLVASRMGDSDITLRSRVAHVLGDVLSPDEMGRSAPDEVRVHLLSALSEMRPRAIYALLQVAVKRPELHPQIARILNACPYAGSHMAEILADRGAEMAVRQEAARFIGLVGFLDTEPALERLAKRLEARQSGQRGMPFAPPALDEEEHLLPAIQTALDRLRAS